MSPQERPPDVTPQQEQTVTLLLDQILCLLAEGALEPQGLIPWSSNTTLLVTVRGDERSILAIYKPQRGERPLWDFPHGSLGQREVAAYLVCEALGWGLVPPTVLRRGPYGPGSVQLFIPAVEGRHFFTIQGDPAYAESLKRLAVFDIIANNADRKSGHCLVDQSGRLWAIDNALTFHAEPKLRTVIWDYQGQPLPAEVMSDLRTLVLQAQPGGPLSQALAQLLSPAEVAAFRRRLQRLIEAGCYPEPGPGRAVPWPLI